MNSASRGVVGLVGRDDETIPPFPSAKRLVFRRAYLAYLGNRLLGPASGPKGVGLKDKIRVSVPSRTSSGIRLLPQVGDMAVLQSFLAILDY
ncbi:hypothetical protein TWF225_009460 [Orbilia oligospora]|nr:hypothetical protein TWF225_009460 [Orbilia oligospora]